MQPTMSSVYFKELIVVYDFFLLLINKLVNIICILGEALPVVNVTQLEKDTILVCYDSKYSIYIFKYFFSF